MVRRTGIVSIVAIGLVLTSAAVYSMNMPVVAPSVGFALAILLAAVLVASIETAWPEPRPEVVEELVKTAASTPAGADVAAIKARMRDKGGTDAADARWELARLACDVVIETREREGDDFGGGSVGRFIVQAAKAVRDDDDAKRIFAALILPAVARRA